MEIKKINIQDNTIEASSLIKEAMEQMKEGKVIVFPTDTVYGILADATNKEAVEKVFNIKKRDKDKPLPLFIKDIGTTKRIAQVDRERRQILNNIWPGKTTAILKRKPASSKSGLKLYGIAPESVGIRIPDFKLLNLLLEKMETPLVQTSANISQQSASVSIDTIIEQFQNKTPQPDFVINAGNLPQNNPSVILDLTTLPPKILRT